jgi:hypothetical protein
MSSTKKSVIIGVDPHKMSVTIEVVDTHERPSVAVGSTPPTPAMPRCAVM